MQIKANIILKCLRDLSRGVPIVFGDPQTLLRISFFFPIPAIFIIAEQDDFFVWIRHACRFKNLGPMAAATEMREDNRRVGQRKILTVTWTAVSTFGMRVLALKRMAQKSVLRGLTIPLG